MLSAISNTHQYLLSHYPLYCANQTSGINILYKKSLNEDTKPGVCILLLGRRIHSGRSKGSRAIETRRQVQNPGMHPRVFVRFKPNKQTKTGECDIKWITSLELSSMKNISPVTSKQVTMAGLFFYQVLIYICVNVDNVIIK